MGIQYNVYEPICRYRSVGRYDQQVLGEAATLAAELQRAFSQVVCS